MGTETPYAGTVDVQINENNATLNYGGEATLSTDNDDNGSRVQSFLRFDDIVGTNPGQIPPGSKILSANLVFSATSSTKGKVKMHRMLVPWGEHSTWMDFTPSPVSWGAMTYLNTDTGIYRYITLPSVMDGGGMEANDVEAASAEDFVFTMPKPVPAPFILTAYGTTYQAPAWDPNTGAAIAKPPIETLSTTTVGLTTTVQAWVDGSAPNHGWFFEPTSSDGWDFETAEGKQPPVLVVTVEGAPLVQ
ncbi:MAG: DNRLRE domain-containing protein [Pedobacter sp.]